MSLTFITHIGWQAMSLINTRLDPFKATAFHRGTLPAIFFVLVSLLTGSARAVGDPARGGDLFRQNCAACHSQERGQNPWSVRRSFPSSAALRPALRISRTRPR